MQTPVRSPWPELRVDRQSGIPLYLQLKAQLQYAIGRGRIPEHTRLPTMREMAATLGLAVETVRQAYDELEAEGLVVSRQGSGTYTAIPALSPDLATGDEAQADEIDRFLLRALADGLAPARLERLIRHRFALLEGGPVVAFVGLNAPIYRYAELLTAALPDVAEPVRPISLEALRAEPARTPDLLARCTHLVSLAFRAREVEDRAAAAGLPCRTLPIVSALDPSIMERVAALPPDARPLLVCAETSRPIYEALLHEQRPAADPPTFARLDGPDDERRVQDAARDASVVLYTPSVAPVVERLVPADVLRIELVHRPTRDSLRAVARAIQHDAAQAARLRDAAAGIRRGSRDPRLNKALAASAKG